MSKQPERIWTDRELQGLGNTVITLRKIRTAATAQMELPKAGFSGFLSRRFGDDRFPAPENRLAVLEDAERLGFAAGDYLATRLAHERRDPELLGQWESSISETTTKYGSFPGTTFAKTNNLDVIGSTLSRMRMIVGDPEHMMRWDLLENNRLGVSTIDDLSERDIHIIAPLSGDFLIACVYQATLEKTRGETFKLRAAALSRNLGGAVLAPIETGEQTEIGIFMDVIDTTRTGTALHKALMQAYPLATIHLPSSTPTNDVPFKPSARLIRRFGAEAFPNSG